MSDDPVKAGIYNLLIFLHLYGPGKVCVFPKNLRIKHISQQKYRSCYIDDPIRQNDPAKSIIQACNDKSGKKHQSAQYDDGFLLRLFFFCIQALL